MSNFVKIMMICGHKNPSMKLQKYIFAIKKYFCVEIMDFSHKYIFERCISSTRG